MIKRSLTAEKIQEKSNDLKLTLEEKELYNIFLEEYDEIFENILNLGEKAIFNSIISNATVLIGKEKINSYSKLSLAKIQSLLKSQNYMPDILSVKKIREIIISSKQSLNKFDPLNINDIIPHCDNTSKCYHICGEELLYPSKFNFIICLFCKMIYKSTQIHLFCKECMEDYYSEIYEKEEEQIEDYEKAIWEEYHCKNYYYEDMKCPRCNEGLYFSNKRKIFKCFNCKWKNKISNTKWKCKVCGKDFQSKVKIYIKFENKPKKVAVRNALVDKNYAKPDFNFKCKCGFDCNKEKYFIHDYDCNGMLLLGEYQGKKIVICSVCKEIMEYNKVEWFCPNCDNLLEKNTLSIPKFDPNNNDNIQDEHHNILNIHHNSNHKKNIYNHFNSGINVRNNGNFGVGPNNYSINNNINTDFIGVYRNKNTVINVLTENNNKEEHVSRKNSNISNYNAIDTNDYHPIIKPIQTEKSTKNIGINIFKKISQKKDLSSNSIIKIPKNIGLIGPYSSFKRPPSSNKIIPKNNSIQMNFKKDISNVSNEDFINNTHNEINRIQSFHEFPSHNISRENSLLQMKTRENSSKNLINSKIFQNINLNFNVNININNFINNNNNNNNNNSNKISNNYIIEPDEDFDPNDFTINKQVGEGTFGKIYSAIWSKNNELYALKKIISPSLDKIENIRSEYDLAISFIKKTKCSGIIRIFGSQSQKLEEGNYAFFVLMELASGDWEKEIKNRAQNKNYYTEGELINIMKPLIKTFSQLQQNNIAHRDIKPQNILIVGNEYKICDFGEAKIMNNNNDNEHMIRGTELYMSPILFNALKLKKNIVYHNCFKSDVFSLGMCILFAATLTFKSLYNIRELKDRDTIKNILARYLVARYSFEFVNIILKMLEINEEKRPDFIELENNFRD